MGSIGKLNLCCSSLFIGLVSMFLIINSFLIGLTYCDHLRQTNDEAKEQSSERATNDNLQPADPEYIKGQLKELIMIKIDSDRDGWVSYEELEKYLSDLTERNIEHEVDKQWRTYSPQIHEVFSWEGYEPERKEVLTWDHYFNQTYPSLMGVDIGIPINREQDKSRILNAPNEQEDNKEKDPKGAEDAAVEEKEDPQLKALKVMVWRADARWKLADENGDTLLTKDEFKFLLYPDEGNEELQNLFVREATEDVDSNKDEKISLDEYMEHLINHLADDKEKNDKNWLAGQKSNFHDDLDKNKDGVLEGMEIREWLIPVKSKKLQDSAKRMLEAGDENKDFKLSQAEILQNFMHFLTLLPADYWESLQDNNKPDSILEDGATHDEL